MKIKSYIDDTGKHRKTLKADISVQGISYNVIEMRARQSVCNSVEIVSNSGVRAPRVSKATYKIEGFGAGRISAEKNRGVFRQKFLNPRRKLVPKQKLALSWPPIFKKLESFSTSGAERISAKCFAVAKLLMDYLSDEEVSPLHIQYTVDGGVLLLTNFKSTELLWEVDEDGDLAVKISKKGNAPRYKDLALLEITAFLKVQ